MARARSKSPARKKPAAKASSAGVMDDPNVQLGVFVVTLVVLQCLSAGGPPSGIGFVADFFNAYANDFSIQGYGQVMTTLHVLNSCQNAGSGFWVGSFLDCVIGAFGVVIAGDLLAGDAVSIASDETNLTLALACWYFCNHEIPYTGINVWSKFKDVVSSVAGSTLQSVLDFCSLAYVTNAVIDAANTGGTAGPLGFVVFTPCIAAVAVGAVSEFFPLNKGLKINSCSAQMYSALAIALFTVFQPKVCGLHPALGDIYGKVDGLVGGNFVLASVLLNNLFGHFLPFNPVSKVSDLLAQVTGV